MAYVSNNACGLFATYWPKLLEYENTVEERLHLCYPVLELEIRFDSQRSLKCKI
jgi:hypothetical protein